MRYNINTFIITTFSYIYIVNLCKFNFGRNKLKEIVITFIVSCFFFYIYNK